MIVTEYRAQEGEKMALIDQDELIEKVKKRKELTTKELEGIPRYGEAYARLIGVMGGIDRVRQIIEEMPTVEQQKWIPASERLPELFVNVLVYGTFGFEIMHVEEANYNGGVEWCNDHDYFVPVHNTLWMELHEPFEGENADGEDGEQE